MSHPAALIALLFATAEPPLQTRIDTALKAASPAVVSVWYGKPAAHVTGTVVDPAGLIVTCGHLKRAVGDPVEVRTAAGKSVAGTVVAKHKSIDLALIRMAGKGLWPAAAVGDSKSLTPADALLAIGYPNTYLFANPQAAPIRYVRLTRRREQRLWPNANELLTAAVTKGGDSGGPLFDLSGSLVGVCSSGEADGTDTRYVSSETLLRVWKEFAGDIEAPKSAPGLRPATASASAATAKGVSTLRPSVAEVRVDDRWAGVAAHLGQGLFVTKASELGPRPTLVLADGTVAAAEVAVREPALDLALLKLAQPGLADGVEAIEWADAGPTPGALVAAVTPADFTPPAGVVCVAARPVPPVAGTLPVRVKDAEGGVAVAATFADLTTPWLRPPAFPLQVGDIITGVAGEPTKTRDGFNKLLLGDAKQVGAHPRVAGERVEVAWTRDGKPASAWLHLRPAQSFATQRVRPYSYRHTGFASAFAADFAARPEHCGAPVVDAEGRAVGLLIARAPFVESLALPAAEVRAAVGRMRGAAGK